MDSALPHPDQGRHTAADGGAVMTFWDHLDELRTVLLRVIALTAVAAVAAFLLKDELKRSYCGHRRKGDDAQ